MTEHTNDLDAIEARAKAATPGPWPDPLFDYVGAAEWWIGYGDDAAHEGVPQWSQLVADVEHLRGMDPAVTLALIAEVRQLRAKVARVEALAEEWQRDHDNDANGRHGYHATEYGDYYASDIRDALAGEV